MNMVINRPVLVLGRWDTVELDDAAGVVAEVDSGCVWLTTDGDRRDVVLEAGDRWRIDRSGRTLIQAERLSILRIEGAGHRPKTVPARAIAQIAGMLGRFFRRWEAAPRFVPHY